MTIGTGDFYYFPDDDSIWLVAAIGSVRVRLTFISGTYTTSTRTLLREHIHNFGRYLGNIATTPTSQLKNFYPELFI